MSVTYHHIANIRGNFQVEQQLWCIRNIKATKWSFLNFDYDTNYYFTNHSDYKAFLLRYA